MAKQKKALRPEDLQWEFFTFPVVAGFFLGAFLMLLVGAVHFGAAFIISLFGLSFCAAHGFNQWLRIRTVGRRLQRAEEEERERRALAARANRQAPKSATTNASASESTGEPATDSATAGAHFHKRRRRR